MDKILWLDLETGGLDPRLHDITQIAGIVDINGKTVQEFNILVRPSSPERVTTEALAVTGKTLDEVMAHPYSQQEGYELLTGVLGRHVDKYNRSDKFVWAGQNAPFDMGFARELWRKNGDKYFGSWFHPQPMDLIGITVAMRLKGHLTGLPNLKLVSIAEALGIKLAAHDAMNDIRATREAVYRQLEWIKTPDELGAAV